MTDTSHGVQDTHTSGAAVGYSALKCLQVSVYISVLPTMPTEMNLDMNLYTQHTVLTRFPLPVVGNKDLAKG